MSNVENLSDHKNKKQCEAVAEGVMQDSSFLGIIAPSFVVTEEDSKLLADLESKFTRMYEIPEETV